jgi:hypothetical protein
MPGECSEHSANMTEPDPFELPARYAPGHKVTNRAFRKFWRSLDDCDKASIAQAVGAHFKLSNFIQGPATPIASSDSFPRIRK